MLAPDSGTPTPTPNSEKQKHLWQRPKLSRRGRSGRQVSFTSSWNGYDNGYLSSRSDTSRSDTSRSNTSRPSTPDSRSNGTHLWAPGRSQDTANPSWRVIDRRVEATWREPLPSPAPSISAEPKPFLVYNDRFLCIIGSFPTLQLLMEDTRAPYFQNSPVFVPRTNTLFLSSAAMPDTSPSAAPSRNLQVVMSKIDIYSASDFSRDKVRTPDHAYMPRGGCAHRHGLALCAQGTLSEPSALIYMEAKPPHRTSSLLTNYLGTPLNNPHSCAAHADGSVWFSDPHPPNVPSFRPKPRLPPMIYRFNPQGSDIRAMTNELARPAALAFAPNYKTLYVIDEASAPASAAPCATSRGTIYAFSVAQTSSFLTQKRLFALPSSTPSALATDVHGNVYAACEDGLHVFDDCGSLVGKILVDGGATGVCFGRNGEVFVCGGNRMWRVQLDPETKGAALRV